MRIHASDQLNSGTSTRPLSLVLKIYKLKGYEDFIARCDDGVFYTDQQCEAHQEALWDEFDGATVSAVYEDRLKELETEVPVTV